ncbi:hypothetical protein I4U23_015480 [Adineta vaga]|nr:hypothetical protein I4U23_015480 [Adineta vaga]
MSKILVTGGNGVLGRAVSKLFLAEHINFVVGSRHKKTKNYSNERTDLDTNIEWIYMDLTKEEELDKITFDNIDIILHLASSPNETINGQAADIVLTRNLLKTIQNKNIKHFIYISIVGIDRIPLAYYEGKLECERLVKESGVPYTILRATQFHEFAEDLTNKLLRFPICLVPKALKIQPIQVEAVAMELSKIMKTSPLNDTYDIGGKKIYNMGEIASSLLEARHESKWIINIPTFGGIMNAVAAGYSTCENIVSSSNTWEEYLSNKYVH